MGIWGPSASELYIVGGSPKENGGRILRYDGEAFKTETVPEGPLLWWVHGMDSDHVWAVGEGGRILRKQGEGWTDESPDIDERLVLWGVWAAASNDIWAVGGSVRRNGPERSCPCARMERDSGAASTMRFCQVNSTSTRSGVHGMMMYTWLVKAASSSISMDEYIAG